MHMATVCFTGRNTPKLLEVTYLDALGSYMAVVLQPCEP